MKTEEINSEFILRKLWENKYKANLHKTSKSIYVNLNFRDTIKIQNNKIYFYRPAVLSKIKNILEDCGLQNLQLIAIDKYNKEFEV
jgi:hypothetical protein